MDDAPADYIRNADDRELETAGGISSTGPTTEKTHGGLSCAFDPSRKTGASRGVCGGLPGGTIDLARPGGARMRGALHAFKQRFFRDHPAGRTGKHVADPLKAARPSGCACTSGGWSARSRGVDLGMWPEIPLHALRLPLDVHTGNVARQMGLLKRKASDWRAVEEVTDVLRMIDPNDPVRYDFALFGLGVTGPGSVLIRSVHAQSGQRFVVHTEGQVGLRQRRRGDPSEGFEAGPG